jgi:hypothetical protein
VFAFDVNPQRTASAIAAASPLDGRTMVEVVDHRPGTAWVVPRLLELRDRWKPRQVVCDAAGPAGSLLAGLANAGLDVKVVNAREYAQACGMFYDAVVDDALTHPDQETLNAAVAVADRRTMADAWMWSRRASTAESRRWSRPPWRYGRFAKTDRDAQSSSRGRERPSRRSGVAGSRIAIGIVRDTSPTDRVLGRADASS